MNKAAVEVEDSSWKSLYKIAATAIVLVVVVGFIEISITFFPEGNIPQETVIDRFALIESNWFFGLRNLGLLNIPMAILGVPAFLALYGAHRRVNQAYAMLAMIIAFIGAAVFLATNRAFSMLVLSSQYAAATTDAQRAVLAAAGEALLSVGEGHTPGSWLGFFLSEVAGIIISVVMLKGKVFSKANAYAGIAGFTLLLIFDSLSAFAPGLANTAMLLAMIGGPLNMVWYILIAQKLFQLGRSAP